MKGKSGFFVGWMLSLMVASLIAGFTVFVLSKSQGFPYGSLLISGVTVFWCSFIVVMLFMELVVLREAKKIIRLTEKKKKKKDADAEVLQVERPGMFNPMRRMYEEVFSFTTTKEQEIAELQKAEHFRREFVANVSHELKTPLFAAQGFIHTLVDGADQDPKVRKNFLNKAARSLDDLEALVQDILKLSQIESGEIKMKMEPVDMGELCEKIAESFRPLADKKHIDLVVKTPKAPALAMADKKWIGQVLTNLISNAINYSHDHTRVQVGVAVSKKSVITAVKDQGEGIPEAHLARIFERFYRVDKSRSKELGGTGLGLAIVKHILEAHHTRADVKSEPGKGSEFSFRLKKIKEKD
ncbi:MAG: sensor histidine kinase [Bacteroidota bacterium]